MKLTELITEERKYDEKDKEVQAAVQAFNNTNLMHLLSDFDMDESDGSLTGMWYDSTGNFYIEFIYEPPYDEDDEDDEGSGEQAAYFKIVGEKVTMVDDLPKGVKEVTGEPFAM